MSLPVKETLISLVKLSETDNKIDHLKEEQTELPQEIQVLQSQIQDLQNQIVAVQTGLETAQSAKKESESFIREKTQWITDREARVNNIKTTKEFQAALREVSLAKKEIKDKQTGLEECSKKMAELEQQSADLKAKHEPKIQELKNSIEQKQQRLGQLEEVIAKEYQQREQTLQTVADKKSLAYYNHVHNRVSPAMAEVHDGICAECGTRILPQVLNLIVVSESLHTCNRCKRILYLREELNQEQKQ